MGNPLSNLLGEIFMYKLGNNLAKFVNKSDTYIDMLIIFLMIIKISRNEDFLVYQKPSNADMTIYYRSLRPYQPKLSANNSMVHQ